MTLPENFYELIEKQAEAFSSRTFFIWAENGNEVTFSDFHKATSKVCSVLKKYKIKPDERVAIIISNRPEWLYCHYGCLKYGCVSAAVSPFMSCDELIEIIEKSKIDYIIIGQQSYEKIKKEIGSIGSVKKIFGIDFSDENVIDFEAEFDDADEVFVCELKPKKRDTAIITFSAGSTGRPKAIPQSNKWLIEQAAFKNDFFSFTKEDKFLCVQYLFYTDWFVYTLMPLLAGGSFVLTKRFSKKSFWEQVEKHKITFVNGSPAHLNILLNPPEDVSGKDVSCFRIFISSGSQLKLETLNQFEHHYPSVTVCDCYGSSEAGWISMTLPDKKKRRADSVGKILPYVGYKIVDEGGEELKEFEQGELVITDCPYIMEGYINLPQETRQRIRKDGYHTGDLCIVDSDDYLYVKGRIVHLINRGGEKISPKEVEAVMQKHPSVGDCVIMGIPDRIFGEEVISFVVIKYGTHATERDIMEHCAEHLSKFKCPKKIFFVEEIPKTKADKTDTEALKQLYFQYEKEKNNEKEVFVDNGGELR